MQIVECLASIVRNFKYYIFVFVVAALFTYALAYISPIYFPVWLIWVLTIAFFVLFDTIFKKIKGNIAEHINHKKEEKLYKEPWEL